MSEIWKVPEVPVNGRATNGKNKSHEQDEYFHSYEDLEVHRLMVMDKARTGAYHRAIEQHSHLFEDKVVLDVGCGTGVLSLMAAKAGARRVYAVEAAEALHSLASRVVKDNKLQHTITVIHGRVEEVEIPEKVDVLVSEWMGFFLLHESMLSSVIVARDRFLKPDGMMIPSIAELYVCPSTLESFHAERLACWRDVYGHDMSAVERVTRQSMQSAPQITSTHPEELLASPELVCRLHLLYVSDEELQQFHCRRFVTVTRDGTYRALCLWFRCLLTTESAESEFLMLDTSPHAPTTHWKQTAVVLPRDFDIENREVVGFEVALARCESEENSGDSRRYAISVSMLDEDAEHPVPCGCAVAKCRLMKALLDKEEAEQMSS